MKTQLKHNDLYLIINASDEFTEPLFVCMNKDGYCWIQNIFEEIDLPNFQRSGIIYKKATNSLKVAEFISKNNPVKFSEDAFIKVFKEQQPNVKMYYTSNILHGNSKCNFNHFIHNILQLDDTGEMIMKKLKENNPVLHSQLSGRGKADLVEFTTKPPFERYVKFHEFIKKNW